MNNTKYPKCKKCDTYCQKGIALHQANAVVKDDKNFTTIYPNQAPATLINCYKCPKCGHSFTI